MMISRRALLAGMAAAAVIPSVGFASTARKGGQITFMLNAEPPALVTLATTVTQAVSVSAKVTEGLLAYDYDMTPKPQLATEWSISEDGKAYTFKLREGVKWHDGKDFTSADVAYSLEMLKQHHPRGRNTLANVAEVQTPDPLTAIVVLSKPAPYLIRALTAAEMPIMPKHIYEGTDPLTNPNNSAPIGTGPFVFKEWVRSSHIIYERNENYWEKDLPRLDRIIVKFYPEAGARSIAFETGDADIGYRTPVALSDVERLKSLPHLRFETKGTSYSYNVNSLQFNLDSEHFGKKKFRQAVAHSIDRDALIKVALFGQGVPCASPIAPLLKDFHDPSPSPYAYDLKAAEALLDEAGYPKGSDGVRVRLELDYNPLFDGSQRIAEFVKGALERVGIVAEIRSQDGPAFNKRIYTDRDFHFTVHGHSNLFDPTVGVQRIYWSKNFKIGLPTSNGSHYNNPRVDELLEGAAVEPDQAKRKEMFSEFQKIVMEELPDLNLYTPTYLTIVNQRLQDHSVTADGPEGNMAYAWVDA